MDFKITKIIFISILLVFLNSCMKEETKKSSGGSVAKYDPSKSYTIKWPNSQVISGLDLRISTSFSTLFLDSDKDSDNHNLFEQMMKSWNNSTSSYDFFRVPSSTTTNKEYSSLTSYRDSEMGIYKSTNWFSNLKSDVLAVTQFFAIPMSDNTLELIHADIIVNFKHHQFSMDATSNSEYDLPTVILHELGHFIGLGHEENYFVDSIMQPYLREYDTKRSITASDTSKILGNYHVSSLRNATAFAAASSAPKLPVGEVVQGLIELKADGKCVHKINNQIIHTH